MPDSSLQLLQAKDGMPGEAKTVRQLRAQEISLNVYRKDVPCYGALSVCFPRRRAVKSAARTSWRLRVACTLDRQASEASCVQRSLTAGAPTAHAGFAQGEGLLWKNNYQAELYDVVDSNVSVTLLSAALVALPCRK